MTSNKVNVHELGPVKTEFEIINKAYVNRKQFPICIAYAITIHKNQGLSLNNALKDIGSTVFTYGQAYVEFSIVISLDSFFSLNVDFGSIEARESSRSSTGKQQEGGYIYKKERLMRQRGL